MTQPPDRRRPSDAIRRRAATNASIDPWLVNTSALTGIENLQRGLVNAPALKALENVSRVLVDSPAIKGIENLQRGLVNAPALKALENVSRVLVDSPAIKGIRDVTRNLGAQYVEIYEHAVRYYDERWAELETENSEHPPPVLFVVGSLGVAVGRPLYEAVKLRRDDSELLEALEPVLTDADFIAEVRAAVQAAPHLNAIQKRHLITALGWLAAGHYVDAYPPFYNGLEAAFYSAARAAGVIDDSNQFLHRKGKASKVEDLFDDLVEDVRFKRFLRAWIFGNRGNPFRHGDVDDPDECRRQSLRLGVAVIGWLEIFGGWSASPFAERLETEAAQRRQLITAKSGEAAGINHDR